LLKKTCHGPIFVIRGVSVLLGHPSLGWLGEYTIYQKKCA